VPWTESAETVLFSGDWFVLGKEVLPFQKIGEWLPWSAQGEHILPVHGAQSNLCCFPYELVPASGILNMLVLLSRMWWTTSLLCSVVADFPGWYSRMQQSCSLTLVALEWPIFSMRVWEGTHSTLQPWRCKQPCSSEMSTSTHITRQCHNSTEHLIYLQYLNMLVPQFSFTHYICNSGTCNKISVTQFESSKVNILIFITLHFHYNFYMKVAAK
jgi:hypothetical protein